LKRYTLKFNSNTINYSNLEREIQINKILYEHYDKCSENITCFFDISKDDNYYYLVGDLFDLDLEKFISLIQNYSIETKLKIAFPIFYNLLSGLTTLDELGIIYRDMKPSNVFVKILFPDKIKVSIADFDHSCSNFFKNIDCNNFVGTFHYLDPVAVIGYITNTNVDINKSEYDVYSTCRLILNLLDNSDINFFSKRIADMIIDNKNITEDDLVFVIKYYKDRYEKDKNKLNNIKSFLSSSNIINKDNYIKFINVIIKNLNPKIMKPNPIKLFNDIKYLEFF
jgi:serine/threonine protein kinase